MAQFTQSFFPGWSIDLSYDEAEEFAELFGNGLEFDDMLMEFSEHLRKKEEKER